MSQQSTSGDEATKNDASDQEDNSDYEEDDEDNCEPSAKRARTDSYNFAEQNMVVENLFQTCKSALKATSIYQQKKTNTILKMIKQLHNKLQAEFEIGFKFTNDRTISLYKRDQQRYYGREAYTWDVAAQYKDKVYMLVSNHYSSAGDSSGLGEYISVYETSTRKWTIYPEVADTLEDDQVSYFLSLRGDDFNNKLYMFVHNHYLMLLRRDTHSIWCLDLNSDFTSSTIWSRYCDLHSSVCSCTAFCYQNGELFCASTSHNSISAALILNVESKSWKLLHNLYTPKIKLDTINGQICMLDNCMYYILAGQGMILKWIKGWQYVAEIPSEYLGGASLLSYSILTTVIGYKSSIFIPIDVTRDYDENRISKDANILEYNVFLNRWIQYKDSLDACQMHMIPDMQVPSCLSFKYQDAMQVVNLLPYFTECWPHLCFQWEKTMPTDVTFVCKK